MKFLIAATLVSAAAMFGSSMGGGAKVDSDSDKEKKERLEAVKKKLPGQFDQWRKELVGFFVEKPSPMISELKLQRWLGPSEVKLTYSCRFKIENQDFSLKVYSPIILAFTLRYYDGNWTRTSVTTNQPALPGADLMLLADRAIAD